MPDLLNSSPLSRNGRGIEMDHVDIFLFKEGVLASVRNTRDHGQMLHVLETLKTLNHEKNIVKFETTMVGKTCVLLGLVFKLNNFSDCLAK